MVFGNEKRSYLLAFLVEAAKLCKQVGLVGWDQKLLKSAVPKIGRYKGSDCKDVYDALKRREDTKYEVDLFEIMLCNELSTYIDKMPLNRERAVEEAPPFALLNDIVMAHALVVQSLVGHIVVMNGVSREDETQFYKANVPLEYVHTLIRVYNNKCLLLAYIGKRQSFEYVDLHDKCQEFLEQYISYPFEERKRVSAHFGRTCLGQIYNEEEFEKQEQKRLQEREEEIEDDE